MNKLLLAGLMFFSVNNAFSMGKQEREMLYTLHTMGQNFAEVPMITQNLDIFMSAIEMNICLNEIELAAADKKFEKTLLDSAVLFTGALISKVAFNAIVDRLIKTPFNNSFSLKNVLVNGSLALGAAVGITWPTLNVHDAWNARVALIAALERDKEILDKLQAIQGDMAKGTQPEEQYAEQVENFLLESAE